MQANKIKTFMRLGGQPVSEKFTEGNQKQRELGAQLLLSETLEYVIKGLGVTPVVDGYEITNANNLKYVSNGEAPDKLEMLDGLADVAYTMYWNSCAFGMPLEEAFDVVCDNNLEKFVKLETWKDKERGLERSEWDLGKSISWPEEVVAVEVVKVENNFYAVGKDKTGKVRKPSNYKSVSLDRFLKS